MSDIMGIYRTCGLVIVRFGLSRDMICSHVNIEFGRLGFMSQLSMCGYVQTCGYVDRSSLALRNVLAGRNSEILQASGPGNWLLLVDESVITV